MSTAARQDFQNVLHRAATSAATLWATAQIGFAGAKAFQLATNNIGEMSYLSHYAPQLALAQEAQRVEDTASAVKRSRHSSFGMGPGQHQGLTPFVKGGWSWDSSGGQHDNSYQTGKRAAKHIAAAKGGGVSWVDVQDPIVCFNCGVPGHKSTECLNRSGYQSAAQPAAPQSWGADLAGYSWQPSGQGAEQSFPALEWHQDWQPEARQNTQATWGQNTGRGAGKYGGKSTGGKNSGFGGYGKNHGATWNKGGGKSGGWSSGGRGKY